LRSLSIPGVNVTNLADRHHLCQYLTARKKRPRSAIRQRGKNATLLDSGNQF
jgi:hypothetical protein